jgi:hypothetical protein
MFELMTALATVLEEHDEALKIGDRVCPASADAIATRLRGRRNLQAESEIRHVPAPGEVLAQGFRSSVLLGAAV